MAWFGSSQDGRIDYWASRPARPMSRRLAFGLVGAVAVGLAAMSQGPSDAAVAAAPEPPAPKPAWIDVGRPLELFALDLPDFAQPALYEARRHEPGGGRRDTLTHGKPGETAFLRIAFYRRGAEPAPPTTLFVEAARRAGEIGFAAAGAGAPDSLTTRFGDFEVSDVRLERGPAEAACLAFRLTAGEDVLRISGLSCGAEGQPVDRATLACQLDRIDLRAAGDDAALRAVFVAAERRRDLRCAPSRQQTAKASWLEPRGAAPALRGAKEATEPAPVAAPARGKRPSR
ncbi:MAG: hypothetical protein JNK46_08075 [Methylobacteriaceae bacterium]|nr:hypothetical protein [Methylobacteriaceae bacterium]